MSYPYGLSFMKFWESIEKMGSRLILLLKKMKNYYVQELCAKL